MPVITEFESRVAELRKMRMDDKAEQNAGYLIGSIYKDLFESFFRKKGQSTFSLKANEMFGVLTW